MEILNFDYCFRSFQNKKQRGASTFNCNAGRLLLIVTRGVYYLKTKNKNYTDSRKQEIVMSKM
jgi:hypothetical protein